MSEGVRGGTINAISSSLPELLTTLIALFLLSDAEGFSVGIGTTAGSALFNGMIIPAVCIFSVVGTVVLGARVNSVNVSLKVLLRDGLTLIGCEFVLIFIISGSSLHWWQGLVLMLLYIGYMGYMLGTMKQKENGENDEDEDEDDEDEKRGPIATLFYWLSLGPILDLERWLVREHHREQMKNEQWNGWPLLLMSSAIMGAACWLLVIACGWLGTGASNTEHPYYELFGQQFTGFSMPAMFVAVIFASMATSVPDTVISIRDARDGDYDDAVANALGSNIFDICFALGFPLFLYTIIYGPIQMNPETVALSGELRLLLLMLTIVGFFIYYIGKRGTTESGVRYVEMKRGKAVLLLTLYAAFATYIVAKSMEAGWAESISALLRSITDILPKLS